MKRYKVLETFSDGSFGETLFSVPLEEVENLIEVNHSVLINRHWKMIDKYNFKKGKDTVKLEIVEFDS